MAGEIRRECIGRRVGDIEVVKLFGEFNRHFYVNQPVAQILYRVGCGNGVACINLRGQQVGGIVIIGRVEIAVDKRGELLVQSINLQAHGGYGITDIRAFRNEKQQFERVDVVGSEVLGVDLCRRHELGHEIG